MKPKIQKLFDHQIKHWICFNDKEIGLLQFYVIDYLKENQFDSEASYNLGIISTQIQYYMRCIKELILKKDSDTIPDILHYMELLDRYPNICLFVKNKLSCGLINSYGTYEQNYLTRGMFETFYFEKSPEEIEKNMKSDWDKIYTALERYRK